MCADRDHPIFYTDPSEWMNYVGKEVCVTIETGESHTGWVYTIDPVSRSVVLLRFNDTDDDDKIKVKVVMGHAVQSIVVLDDNVMKHKAEFDGLFKPKELQTGMCYANYVLSLTSVTKVVRAFTKLESNYQFLIIVKRKKLHFSRQI